MELCKVKVTGIPPSIKDKDMLCLYFEYKKKSGGGYVDDIVLDDKNNIAIVKFENAEDARNVCERSHTIGGHSLTVTLLTDDSDIAILPQSTELEAVGDLYDDQSLNMSTLPSIDSDAAPQQVAKFQLGEYVIDLLSEIGRGISGTVYKGHHKQTGQTVAVKRVQVGGTDESRELMKEIRTLRNIQHHRNLLQLMDFHYLNNSFFLLMDFCDLGDLENYIRKQNPGMNTKTKLMFQISLAIEHLHHLSPPIIHRDIKPSNILLMSEYGKPIVKVTDFGIAKIFTEDSESMLMESQVGTPAYMAPEFFARAKYTKSIDVFSLGLVFLVLTRYTEGNIHSFVPLIETPIRISAVGQEMYEAHLREKPQPTVVSINDDDDEQTKVVKLLIQHMTCFNAPERLSISEVVTRLQRVVKVDDDECPEGDVTEMLALKDAPENYVASEELECTKDACIQEKSRLEQQNQDLHQKVLKLEEEKCEWENEREQRILKHQHIESELFHAQQSLAKVKTSSKLSEERESLLSGLIEEKANWQTEYKDLKEQLGAVKKCNRLLEQEVQEYKTTYEQVQKEKSIQEETNIALRKQIVNFQKRVDDHCKKLQDENNQLKQTIGVAEHEQRDRDIIQEMQQRHVGDIHCRLRSTGHAAKRDAPFDSDSLLQEHQWHAHLFDPRVWRVFMNQEFSDMSEDQERHLLENRIELISSIDYHEILDYLIQDQVLTWEQQQELMQERSQEEVMRQILAIVKRAGQRGYFSLLGGVYATRILKSSGYTGRSTELLAGQIRDAYIQYPERALNTQLSSQELLNLRNTRNIQHFIAENNVDIIHKLNVRDVLDCIVEDDVLSEEQRGRILAESTRVAQNRLFVMLLQKVGDLGTLSFCRALEKRRFNWMQQI